MTSAWNCSNIKDWGKLTVTLDNARCFQRCCNIANLGSILCDENKTTQKSSVKGHSAQSDSGFGNLLPQGALVYLRMKENCYLFLSTYMYFFKWFLSLLYIIIVKLFGSNYLINRTVWYLFWLSRIIKILLIHCTNFRKLNHYMVTTFFDCN